jgi:hypothetical protein
MLSAAALLAVITLLGTSQASPIVSPSPEDSDAGLLKYLTETDPATLVFHPVPGMPMLEDLNITLADFFEPEFRAKHGLPDPRNTSPAAKTQPRELLQKRGGICWQPSELGRVAEIQSAYACRDYLNSLGNQACVAAGNYNTQTLFCHINSNPNLGNGAYVRGTPSYGFLVSETDTCANVAGAMQWIIDNCSTAGANPCGCGVGGVNQALGNPNLIVSVWGS